MRSRRLKSADCAGHQRATDASDDDQQQAVSGLHRPAKTALAQAEADLKRREPLGASNLIGREELQHARDAVATARAQLDVAVQQYNANRAMILDTSLENQPAVKQNAAALRDARSPCSVPTFAALPMATSPAAACRSGRKSLPPRR